MRDLYPEIQPYNTLQLAVDDVHTLYVEEVGNPDGVPALFLHGGPGAGCEPYHRRFFDPDRYRVVLFDQRGAGRSTPHADLSNNTTWDLVADIEKIRETLGIERWVVFGGSWGSTLALAYAQTHPQRVRALILRGIFLCRPHEIAWFYQQGASRIFPDYWEDFVAPVEPAQRHDMLSAYHRLLTGTDELRRLAAARAWSVWEGRTATLLPDERVAAHFAQAHVALSMARIECHYFMHDAFLRANQLIDDAGRLSGIPGVIVHGRYDAICPLENAWELHHAWSGSELSIIADAGHSAAESGTRSRLVEATDLFAEVD
ncbi:MAG: prolyl aminopeptidase [Gammaproteobacteria bacterium]|mgnify:CR=1 FL=1|nr:prolyl aminopeptidase [Gammaproteobacteria bacterium]MCP5317751.1 prolyl aminopeptidase [Chromatiaceae bacterium]MCW5585651.1 prolyl aminopeptidase [Chromatiales bacterium]MCB1816609.1 prolyl aminopeptidase [Gammaproteobacteria bacterium]MCP5429233.1 prolyl aminopeptidase [Chromatiaceae bacterium]